MATRRKTYKLRGGDVYDVEEYPDGRYGAKRKGTAKEKETDAGTDGGRITSQALCASSPNRGARLLTCLSY